MSNISGGEESAYGEDSKKSGDGDRTEKMGERTHEDDSKKNGDANRVIRVREMTLADDSKNNGDAVRIKRVSERTHPEDRKNNGDAVRIQRISEKTHPEDIETNGDSDKDQSNWSMRDRDRSEKNGDAEKIDGKRDEEMDATRLDNEMENVIEKDAEVSKEETETDPSAPSAPSRSSQWHPAIHDWMKMGMVVLVLLSVILVIIVTIGVLENIVMILFSVVFLGFLLSIVIILFRRGRLLKDYQAAYFGRIRDQNGFLRKLKEGLEDELGGYEETGPMTGNTFGLIHHLMTMELINGEIVSVNEIHMSNSGVALGTYILVKASDDSRLWSMIDGSMQR